MDSSYTVVDSITTGNGYTLDSHEFRLLPNGHVLLMSYDPQPVAMDTVVPGGRPDAIVEGLIIQELDQERRVVFQWRSWDSMEITDCNSGAVDLADSLIDYVHGNAIELDHDGNLLISSRHLNEITKIDRTTGEIMWRMGGTAVKNEFTFIGDTRGFSHQHDIRRLPNGHVTLFDNGNFLVPPYSRALEYELDEVAKTATLVWSYETTPPRTFGGFMGSVERHDDGATVIGWGGTFNSSRRVTDLHADGTVALEIGFPAQVFSYRAHRFPWRTTRLLAAVDTLDFGVVPYGGDPVTRTVTLSNRSAIPTAVTCVDVILSAFAADSAAFTLAPGESRDVAVTFDPRQAGAHAQRLYVRSVTDTEIVATSVELRAVTDPLTAVDTPRVTGFGLRAVRPNPVGRRGTFTFDLPASAEVRLEIFSADGRRVRTVTRGMHAAGRHEVAWNADGLAAGVYFARLASSGRASSAKFVVMERH
jgi:hypothetical protein